MLENLSFINKPLFTVAGNGYAITDIAIVILIMVFGFYLANGFKRLLNSPKIANNMENRSTRILLGNFGKYVIIVITFIIALQTLGINLSSLTVIIGALSVGIGFGLKNIINNLVSGIILIFEGSIKIGDMIELDPTTFGKVEEIRLRSTVIKTPDNIEILIPNGDLTSSRVINRTLSDNIRRLTVSFSVAYGTKDEDVKTTILKAIESCDLVFIKNNDEKKPVVRMNTMATSSVDYILLIYVDQGNSQSSIPSDFLTLIYNTLNENSITIPFPQMDVHLYNK